MALALAEILATTFALPRTIHGSVIRRFTVAAAVKRRAMRLAVALATALALESFVRGGLALAKTFSFALAFRAAERWLELAFAPAFPEAFVGVSMKAVCIGMGILNVLNR